ncbi:hypothetical protein DM02DRAFT_689769 [Periconia macrospinosa]|uniref:Uncharacterized protein n=1 Tax=Periconia macrospinosa TaxID=97972 RepID=A0A2V1E3F5_9PLEO|nr:hypothetical protein DM02DRAFT_689769 [Periconia macrospinosa]
MTTSPALSSDPYALAYRYDEFMLEKPKRRREENNPYYESLLANQPDPPVDATDPLSRAIRYAKEHYESYYEIKHVDLIVKFLDEKADP